MSTPPSLVTPTPLQRCVASIEHDDRDAMERWLSYPAERFPAALASVLRSWWQRSCRTRPPSWTEAYRCSRDAVTPLIDMMEPSDLIERITNGIAYDIPLGIRRLVLIPSVSLRPWTLTYEVGDRVYVYYPVADEHLEADPGAPPQWLVRLHKALGDDRRLRMLRRLAEESGQPRGPDCGGGAGEVDGVPPCRRPACRRPREGPRGKRIRQEPPLHAAERDARYRLRAHDQLPGGQLDRGERKLMNGTRDFGAYGQAAQAMAASVAADARYRSGRDLPPRGPSAFRLRTGRALIRAGSALMGRRIQLPDLDVVQPA